MIKSSAEMKRDAIKAEIERRGMHCYQQGQAWRVTGHGVEIVVSDLSYIEAKELNPGNFR